MAEVAFSSDGKYFSAISQDGRLKIWDTETNVLKQEYTPDLHLSSPPSCLQWISIKNTETPKKSGKRKSSISETQSQCVALGTTNGKILIYSVSEAKVDTVLEDKTNDIQGNKITSLDWHPKYGLFSSSRAGLVYEWELKSGQVRNKYNVVFDSKNKQTNYISAIKIVPHNQNTPSKYLITASYQVRLWRLLDSVAEPLKILGHSSTARPILTLGTHNNRCWLVEGSQNERLLSLWDVTITQQNLPLVNGDDVKPKKQRKKSISEPLVVTNPIYNFILEDAPKNVDLMMEDNEGSVVAKLTATTRSGVVHYYEHTMNGHAVKPIKPTVTLQCSSHSAAPLPLQCCHIQHGGLSLAYLDGINLHFEHVIPDTKTKTQVLIRGEANSKSSKQTDETNKTNDIGNKVTYVEPLGGVARKRLQPGAKVEVPMEARLANLELDTKGRSKTAVNQNLTKLLIQGLHSNDKDMILSVLQNEDPAVSLRTLSGLPANYVPALIEQLSEMANRRTSQCAAACNWISSLVRTHSALLLATLQAKSGQQLAQLLAVFTQRRSHLCQLLNLKGRLDLTISQRIQDKLEYEDDAVLEYNDTSSDEEMQVERYISDDEQDTSSEKSWDKSESESDS